jgi:nucleoside permease NupC
MPRRISLLGLGFTMLCAWLLSSHLRRVPWRVIAGELALQFTLAALLLHAPGLAGEDGFLAAFNKWLQPAPRPR